MSKRILLVEDDAAIMETLTLFLRYEGYEVIKARNVAEVEVSVRQPSLDVALLDYMLQDCTAELVVRKLRAEFGRALKIILFTAADDAVGKGDAVSADAVVAKPFELDFLLEKIKQCLGPRVARGSSCVVPPRE